MKRATRGWLTRWLTMKTILLVLFMTGCNTGGICTTDNGIQFIGYPNGKLPDVSWSCERFNEVESRMVGFMGNGERLRGYALFLYPSASFVDPYKRNVGGYTQCPTKEIYVGIEPTVFAHELAHALQNCNAVQPIDPGSDWDHANWHRDHIYQMIDEASL